MLTRLQLNYFKNFQNAELKLGDFTVLIGANAAGKSNVCDAIRVLAGIGRGYSLPEVFGEKRGPGGDLIWEGIRGGMLNAIYAGFSSFEINASGEVGTNYVFDFDYRIVIGTTGNVAIPMLREERLITKGDEVFELLPPGHYRPKNADAQKFDFCLSVPWHDKAMYTHARSHAVLSNLMAPDQSTDDDFFTLHATAEDTATFFASTQFIDFAPDSLRLPAAPGQTTLGSRGENLSSVLMGLCENQETKNALLEWLKVLTPMDVVDLRFPKYSAGRVQLSLVEAGGVEIPAESASDGTLRFLGFLAQMMSAPAFSIIVFEEIEAGIHPLRLHVLVDLIERTAANRSLQVIATTHSPQLLQYLSAASLETTSLVYREPGQQKASIIRVLDIPNAREALQQTSISELAAGSWLEDAVFLSHEEPAP